MTDERKDHTMQGTTIQIGTRVSYEDMANPRREGRIVGEIAGQWAVRWDEHDEIYRLLEQHGVYFHTTVTKTMLERAIERVEKAGGRSAGWNVIAVDPHDLELAPALLDELGIDDRINADAAALETLLDDDRDDVAIAKALAVIITTPTIRGVPRDERPAGARSGPDRARRRASRPAPRARRRARAHARREHRPRGRRRLAGRRYRRARSEGPLMGLRARKRLGPLTLSKSSASVRVGGRRVHASTSSRGRALGVRLLPGISWWKRIR
jgi:hypothetical protein